MKSFASSCQEIIKVRLIVGKPQEWMDAQATIKERLVRAKDEVRFLISFYEKGFIRVAEAIPIFAERIADLEAGIKILEGKA